MYRRFTCSKFPRGGRREAESEAEKGVKRACARIAGERKRAPAGAGVIWYITRGKYAISRSHKFSQSNERPFLSTRVAAALLMREQHMQVGQYYAACMHACTPTQNLNSTPRIVYPGIPYTFRSRSRIPCCRKSARQIYRHVMRSCTKKKKKNKAHAGGRCLRYYESRERNIYERTRRIWYWIFAYSELEQEGIKKDRESKINLNSEATCAISYACIIHKNSMCNI